MVTTTQAQFRVNTSFGQGLSFDKDFNYSLYQSTINIEPGYSFGKFSLNGVSSSVISDSVASFYTGLSPSYKLWEKSEKSFSIRGNALIGEAGKKLIGIGCGYTNDKVTFGLNAYREMKEKELWIEATFGIFVYEE